MTFPYPGYLSMLDWPAWLSLVAYTNKHVLDTLILWVVLWLDHSFYSSKDVSLSSSSKLMATLVDFTIKIKEYYYLLLVGHGSSCVSRFHRDRIVNSRCLKVLLLLQVVVVVDTTSWRAVGLGVVNGAVISLISYHMWTVVITEASSCSVCLRHFKLL